MVFGLMAGTRHSVFRLTRNWAPCGMLATGAKLLLRSPMDERCKTCPCICKRLDLEDDPVHYHFTALTPNDVIALVERIAAEYRYWEIGVEEHHQSAGHQLALLFNSKSNTDQGLDLLVLAQASNGEDGTDLWF